MSIEREVKLMIGYWFTNDQILDELSKDAKDGDDDFLEEYEGCHAYLAEMHSYSYDDDNIEMVSNGSYSSHFIGYEIKDELDYDEHMNNINKLAIKVMEVMNRDDKPKVSNNIYTY